MYLSGRIEADKYKQSHPNIKFREQPDGDYLVSTDSWSTIEVDIEKAIKELQNKYVYVENHGSDKVTYYRDEYTRGYSVVINGNYHLKKYQFFNLEDAFLFAKYTL